MTAHPTLDFEGLNAIVTGGASGIGASTVELLTDRGARVAVLDRDETDTPEGGVVVTADITDDASVVAAVNEAATRLGGIDVVVNSAGIGAVGTVAETSDEEWRRIFEVNVFGTVRVCRAALPHLLRSSHAAIVNVCSVAANLGFARRAAYGATKGALVALTIQMAADHVNDGVRVNAVSPATANTPWISRLLDQAADPAAERKALNARQPMGRLVEPEEVAFAIAYLASPLAASTTGIIIPVDAGINGIRTSPPKSKPEAS